MQVRIFKKQEINELENVVNKYTKHRKIHNIMYSSIKGSSGMIEYTCCVVVLK